MGSWGDHTKATLTIEEISCLGQKGQTVVENLETIKTQRELGSFSQENLPLYATLHMIDQLWWPSSIYHIAR